MKLEKNVSSTLIRKESHKKEPQIELYFLFLQGLHFQDNLN